MNMYIERIRNILNLLFMAGAVASIILFYTTESEDNTVFVCVCGTSIIIKMIEYVLRFIQKNQHKRRRRTS